MKSSDAPRNLDWVLQRSKCFLHIVFKELEQGVREDVAALEDIYPADPAMFSVASSTKHFAVTLATGEITPMVRAVVDFELSKDTISVRNGDTVLMTARLGMNSHGRCMLEVNDEPLEQWQFRRMALEKLFFGPRNF